MSIHDADNQSKRCQIESILDRINRSCQELKSAQFNQIDQESIVRCLMSCPIEPGNKALIVGTSNQDYLPFVMTEMGMLVSCLDVDVKSMHEQEVLHESLGIANRVRCFTSYSAIKDQTFDMVFVLGVMNELLYQNRDSIQTLIAAARGQEAGVLVRSRLKNFLSDLHPLINSQNGYLFINDVVLVDDEGLLNQCMVMDELNGFIGCDYNELLDIDLSRLILHPAWKNEGRGTLSMVKRIQQ